MMTEVGEVTGTTRTRDDKTIIMVQNEATGRTEETIIVEMTVQEMNLGTRRMIKWKERRIKM